MHRAGTHPLVPLVVYSRVADASAACRDNRAYDRLDHQACADGRQQAAGGARCGDGSPQLGALVLLDRPHVPVRVFKEAVA